MESVDWSKLDRGMRRLYRSYLRLEKNNWAPGIYVHPVLKNKPEELRVIIEHRGEIKPIEELGFRVEGSQSRFGIQGYLPLSIIPALSQLEEVRLIVFGIEDRPLLNTSSLEIRARTNAGNLDNGVWRYDEGNNQFRGNTGSTTVIGIIDTGLDWSHEAFLTTNGVSTRIVSIWDQSLDPDDARDSDNHPESGPNPNLLSLGTTNTYGVEYSKDQIDNAIAGIDDSMFVRHKDDDGHGTHVAGIAAGNGMNPSFIGAPNFDRAGVAPEARIIAVKYLGAEDTGIGPVTRFKDALSYIIEKAASLPEGPPVVINVSVGGNLGAHDGRGDEGAQTEEEALFDTFNEEIGIIGIFAAGNEAGDHQHLEITIPASGEAKVPFFIFDKRLSLADTETLGLDIWYSIDGDPDIKIKFKPPGESASEAVALGDVEVFTFDTNKTVDIDHLSLEAISSHGNVERANIYVLLTPFDDQFKTGEGYELQITGDVGTVLHLWIDVELDLRIDFDETAIAAANGVELSNRSTIGVYGHSPDVITVASYDNENNELSCFSSRGPLIDYEGGAPLVDKPNIAAPGSNISSAKPENCRCGRGWLYGIYANMDGTSMAAPHVSGLVALMLDKNSELSQEDVMDALEAGARAGEIRFVEDGHCDDMEVTDSSPIVGLTEVGFGRIDAKATLDAVPDLLI